jgi:hypothetical protein
MEAILRYIGTTRSREVPVLPEPHKKPARQRKTMLNDDEC